jgi:hypothetical protein
MSFLHRDLLQYALEQEFPTLRHAKDYWCAHRVDDNDFSIQVADAAIIAWQPQDIEEPTLVEYITMCAKHYTAWNMIDLAAKARTQRDALLVAADALIYKAEDAGQNSTALRAYRQALRDVPEQTGFPTDIQWPVVPVAPTTA